MTPGAEVVAVTALVEAALIWGGLATVLVSRARGPGRLLRRISLPPSSCPRCGRRLNWIDKAPIAGWLIRRGSCAGCGGRIPASYPLTEAAAGTLTFTVSLPALGSGGVGFVLHAAGSMWAVSLLALAAGGARPRLPVAAACAAAGASWAAAFAAPWGTTARAVAAAIILAAVPSARGGERSGLAACGALAGWSPFPSVAAAAILAASGRRHAPDRKPPPDAPADGHSARRHPAARTPGFRPSAS